MKSTARLNFSLSLNPVKDYTYIYFDPESVNNIKGTIYDAKGRSQAHQSFTQAPN